MPEHAHVVKPADLTSPSLVYIPFSAPPPSNVKEFSNETCNMLDAILHFQGVIRIEQGEPLRKVPRDPNRKRLATNVVGRIAECLIASMVRLTRPRHTFCRMFRQMYGPSIEPKFDGKIVSSFHDYAMDECVDRWKWLFKCIVMPSGAKLPFDDPKVCDEGVEGKLA